MQFQFNARTVPPAAALDPIPAGWYRVAISATEFKPTKDATGHYLQLEMKVMDGEHKGRVLFDRLNLNNPGSPVNQEIAYKTLSAICHATGVLDVTDTSQLHDKPLEAKVVLKPAEGEYGPKNEIRGYRGLGGGATAAVPGQTAAAGAVPPWLAAAPAAAAAPALPPAVPASTAAAPPWMQPAPTAAPVAPAAPTAPAPFPPAGWLAHPTSPGYFYKGQEVKTEAELRAMSAPAAAPTAPAAAPPWAR